ncbi:Hint domain-containing protein [Methylobacterium sp. NEAU K]|uniref:Hint domain-containing protein n=1 Tax=Methylobacterium sp. NEAU K TaxID=3064946 RepID=UPI002733D680|nr:Hint domain-containing protein [Methylobacterium sp. NEAU K]MDP4006938.1 Hint domain-containing protein [Methylobacterium sp. NEAU K]
MQETFHYSIPADTSINSPAISVDAILTLSNTQNSDNSYNITAISGTRTVGGTVQTIIGLDPSKSDGADDKFWIDPAQNLNYPSSYVTFAGLTYLTNGTSNAAGPGPSNAVNFGYTPPPGGPSGNGGYGEDNGSHVFASSVTAAPYNPTPPATNPIPPANNAPCYCTGTRVLTDRGEVVIERLAIGDVVVTVAGQHRSIKWIGTRRYIGRFANTNPAVLPVCVKAGALADGIPTRDLWVSPDHALYLDGVLIPAEHLVNGVTIVKAERVDSVTYWHIELDSHDVLLAEGAPAESFVDDGGRAIFHNAASFRALYPRQAVWSPEAVYCAPRVTDGYVLESVRRRLAMRAGLPVPTPRVFGALLGHLDLCDGVRITGWAQDLAHPNGPVCLDIVVNGAVVALAYADTYRADLQAAGIGDGCHAFDLDLPQPLSPLAAYTVEVRRSADGALAGRLQIEAAIAVAA